MASRHSVIFSAETVISTPSSLSTSALPLGLDTPRLPCLATGTPAPAVTKAAVVDMLKVCSPSPPVPQVSTASRCSVTTGVKASRMARAGAGDHVRRFPAQTQGGQQRCDLCVGRAAGHNRDKASYASARVNPGPSTTF